MLTLGRWRLAALRDGTFAIDGGALFGIVPRTLWERWIPPDARNRVRLPARCLLALDEATGRRILVDAGMGDAWTARRTKAFSPERSGGELDAGLSAHGLSRAELTDVVLTHLHFEHAGGCVRHVDRGRPEIAFPRATFHVQRRCWQWAHSPSEKDAGAFFPEVLDPLEHSGRLHLVDGELELYPDLELIVSEGHTVAQQLPRFHGDGTHLTHCADLVPTRAHVRFPWISAFDLFPLTTLEEKKMLLAQALEDGAILLLDHDPEVPACRLREEDGRPAFAEAVAL
jgi:glyoxylase-like metal-dependent hydrolase (beta-lactamase superfamily II)